MTEHPLRAENMRLRAELTAQLDRYDALGQVLERSRAEQATTAAQLDGVLRSATWRIASHLGRAAGRVPSPVRYGVRAALRVLRGDAAAAGPGPPSSPPEPAAPAIPGNARPYGLFTQDDAALAANACFARPGDPGPPPAVSIVILNWNRAEMTLACLRYLMRHTAGVACEIIVADNGSDAADLATLAGSALPFRLMPMGRNLFFGEANNVAAEQARGEYLLFLNNDAFVHDGWLPPLLDALAQVPGAGAAGSQLRYPDGTLQEAGALMAPNGSAHQLGKHADPGDDRFTARRLVDYVSAAAMLTRRADFAAVLGFELCYEPAYYEDVDLCLKLRRRGQSVVYCPDSVVTHVENATSQDRRIELARDSAILANRFTFVSRWGDSLLGHLPPPAAAVPPYRAAAYRAGRPRVALCGPTVPRPGGRWRALLAAGQALGTLADVTLLTAAPCSVARLRRVGLDLGIDVSRIAVLTEAAARELPPFDAAIVAGDAALPAGMARHTVALYPGAGAAPADRSVVASEAARRRLAASGRSASVVAVPARRVPPGEKARHILAVGCFRAGPGGHQQDRMIAAFREVVADGPGCVLHLAGSVRPELEHRAFYLALIEAARGLPVAIHPNAAADTLDALYAGSALYWHLAGMGRDPDHADAAAADGLGIALATAMSAGCVPVASARGVAAAMVTDGQDGCLVDTLPGLVAQTRALLADAPRRAALAGQAASASARFDEAGFAAAIRGFTACALQP